MKCEICGGNKSDLDPLNADHRVHKMLAKIDELINRFEKFKGERHGQTNQPRQQEL